MSNMRKVAIAVAIIGAGFADPAMSAVGEEEAKQLGTTLTAFGAEKAGNKEGTIPEYAGGNTTLPAGYAKGSGALADTIRQLLPDSAAEYTPTFRDLEYTDAPVGEFYESALVHDLMNVA